jgi:photosystem II stability/assembly factor-like uncharacterized protein
MNIRWSFGTLFFLSLSLCALTTAEAQLSVTWTSLGPHHIGGPSSFASGKLQALAVFNSNPNIMYAGGGNGSGDEGPLTEAGAFKTTDGGTNWIPINGGLLDPMVNVLWVDQSNANVVLAGTEHTGIFKSTDGGQTWSLTGSFGSISEILSANGSLLAATGAGIAQSTNSGTTWSIVQPTGSPVRALATGGGSTIAGLQNGTIMMQSAPTGTWQTVLTNPGSDVVSVAIDSAAPATAYAVVGCCPGTLVGTSNGGLAWSTLNPPYGPQALIMTAGSHVLYVGCSGVLISTSNAGQSWSVNSYAAGDVRKVFLFPSQSAIILGTDQGLRKTIDDGATWVSLSASVSCSILTAVSVHGSTILTAVQDFSPILSFDGGTSWQQSVGTNGSPPIGEDGAVLINPANPNYCYAYTAQTGYQYSTDAGQTFNSVAAAGLGFVTYVQPGGTDIVAVDPVTPSTVYAASQSGIFKSVDSGVTMNPTNWPLTETTAIAVSPSDSSTIYVGTVSGLYRTGNGGANWNQLSLAGASGYPTTIAINPRDTTLVLVGLSAGPGRGGGILKSTDGGSHFHLVNTGLSTDVQNLGCCGVDMLSLRFRADAMVALATNTAIYLSEDLGEHWQDVNGNSVPKYFSDVAWDDGYLYTSTFGEGVLRSQSVIQPPTPTTLANISTRLRVDTGDNVLIGGFIVTGTQPKKVIVRAIGPSLPVAGKLADPTLELRDGAGVLIRANDNWRIGGQEAEIIATTIPPTDDLESAIVETLPANSARYTAIVRGVNNTTGIGLVEAFDLDRTVDSKLANISTRGLVQTGDNVLIAGTIMLGAAAQKVIVRAIGPSLPVAGALADPTLELRDGNGALLLANDNWRTGGQEAEIIATTIPPTNDFESALIQTLPAGGAAYTAIVRGVNNTTGVALVEIYGIN